MTPPPTSDLARAGLGPDVVAGCDPSGMTGDVLDQPGQLEDALWRVASASLPRRPAPGGLVVCGMGGSGVGADLAAGILGADLPAPLVAVRGYALPPWVGPDHLVLASSYSGHTEEVLACFEAAGRAGARRVALTTGGRLAEAARAEGVPVVGVPSGLQPRAAVAYSTVGALECAAACGAAPARAGEVEDAAALLEGLAAEWGPEGPEDGEAKRLARALHGTHPIVFGAEATAPWRDAGRPSSTRTPSSSPPRWSSRERPQRGLRVGSRPPRRAVGGGAPRGPGLAPTRGQEARAHRRGARRRGRARSSA